MTNKNNIQANRFYITDYEYYTKDDTETETLKISDDKQVAALINSPGCMKYTTPT